MALADQIGRFILEMIAYGGGAAVVAYFIFQLLGKTWIENKFAQRLDQHRHQQALELQRLRVEIDSLLSGTLKIQDKEFQTLPEAWQKLDEAFGRVSSLVSPGQSYPNLDRMTTLQLEEFLAGSELYESQKEDIRSSASKLNTYQEIIFWHRLHEVKKACADFHNYVARNGIFFPPELKGKFTKVSEALWSAIVTKEVGHEAKDWKMQNQGWKKIKEEIEPLYQLIESEIHARLQAHGRQR